MINLGLTGQIMVLDSTSGGGSYDAGAATNNASSSAAAQQAAAAAAAGSPSSYSTTTGYYAIQFDSSMAGQTLTNGQILTLECEIQSKDTSTYSIPSIYSHGSSSSGRVSFTTITPSRNLYATPDGYPLVLQGVINNITLNPNAQCEAFISVTHDANAHFNIKVIRMGLSDPA